MLVTVISTSLPICFAILDHDHGSVIQIAHALIGSLTSFDDADSDLFAGQEDGFERVGDFIQVDHWHILKL